MKARLGDYIQEYSVKNKKGEDIPVYSVTNTQGFCRDYFGKEVASKDKTTYKIVPKGCFAYNPSRINVGSVDWQRYEERVIVSPLYNVFSVSDQLDCQYLYYYLKSDVALQRIRAVATGSVRDNLRFEMLGEFPINIPSLNDQKDIVKKLDGLKYAMKLREEQLAKLDELIKARFVELYNNSSLGEETTLEAITERVKVGFVGTCEKYYTDASGIPMLRTGNITDKGIDLAGLKYVTPEFHEKNKKSQIHEGDLLIARHGSNGQANVYYGKEAQCLNAVVIVPNYEMTTSIFLAGLINSPIVKEQIERTLVGSTQHVVNTKSIAGLVVRIPDLTVQKEYEAFVKQVDKSKVVEMILAA